jgi:hypothetical protein
MRDQSAAELELELRIRSARKAMLKANRAGPSPWPECRRCKLAVEPGDMSWLYPHLCDSHGLGKLESLLRRIVRAHGRRRALKLLKRLAR